MKKPEIVVGEVKIADLRARLRTLLDLKVPRIIYRNSVPVGILLPVETQWYRRLEYTAKQKRQAHAQLDAVVAKLSR